MTWSTKIYWCKPSNRHRVWHLDDATVAHWVTLCGQVYQHDAIRTGEEPEKVCPKCKQTMVKLILRYGVPEVVTW